MTDDAKKFCPASACPLVAPNGSPWTGEYKSICPGHDDSHNGGCPWWGIGCKGGGMVAPVFEADEGDGRAAVVGPNKPKRLRAAPRTYDCKMESECRWHEQRMDGHLCPPREALRRGLDPRVCLF